MNPQEFYVSYNRSVHVFLMCIAALLGPFFFASGIDPQYKKNLVFGSLMVVFFLYNIVKTIFHRTALQKTDLIAFLWVPLLCMPVGLAFALFGASQ